MELLPAIVLYIEDGINININAWVSLVIAVEAISVNNKTTGISGRDGEETRQVSGTKSNRRIRKCPFEISAGVSMFASLPSCRECISEHSSVLRLATSSSGQETNVNCTRY
jgi:hypothetical protein